MEGSRERRWTILGRGKERKLKEGEGKMEMDIEGKGGTFKVGKKGEENENETRNGKIEHELREYEM